MSADLFDPGLVGELTREVRDAARLSMSRRLHHNLKSIVNMLSGNLELLRRSASKSKRETAIIDRVEGLVEFLGRQVDDVRTAESLFEKVDFTRVSFECADLNSVLHDAAEISRRHGLPASVRGTEICQTIDIRRPLLLGVLVILSLFLKRSGAANIEYAVVHKVARCREILDLRLKGSPIQADEIGRLLGGFEPPSEHLAPLVLVREALEGEMGSLSVIACGNDCVEVIVSLRTP
jgi:hypothetical protein